MKQIATIFITLFLTETLMACSFGPMFNSFIENPSYRSEIKPSTPIFEIKGIKRGYEDGNGGSCSDAGMISLAPKEIANKVGATVAYVFKLIEGDFEDDLFPQNPIFSNTGGNFTFIWLDGSNEHQEPIDIKIEIRAVNPKGIRSEPQYLHITDPGT